MREDLLPNGIYEYVSKVVLHDGFWEVHVKNGANENVDMGKAAWYLRELVAEQGGQTVIAILRNVYWDTIDRQLAPESRAREVRDRLTEFVSAISHDHLSNYIPEE